MRFRVCHHQVAGTDAFDGEKVLCPFKLTRMCGCELPPASNIIHTCLLYVRTDFTRKLWSLATRCSLATLHHNRR